MTPARSADFRAFRDGFRWQDVDVLAYKEDGEHFKDICRQVLFEGDSALPCQLRYFEIAAGGHSTLERHQHLHVVMILRGSGRCLVEREVRAIATFDVVRIPPLAWHQFRAANHEPLGFLCLVNTERDRPQLPTPDDLRQLRAIPAIAEFIRC